MTDVEAFLLNPKQTQSKKSLVFEGPFCGGQFVGTLLGA